MPPISLNLQKIAHFWIETHHALNETVDGHESKMYTDGIVKSRICVTLHFSSLRRYHKYASFLEIRKP